MKQRNNKSQTPVYQEFGKLPPQALDLEEAIIGGCMLEKGKFAEVREVLTDEDFYKDTNAMIFRAMDRLNKRMDPIDILTVINELRASEEIDIVGGPYAITLITQRVGSAANVLYHAKIVKEKFIQRHLIKTSQELARDSWVENADPLALLAVHQKELDRLYQMIISGSEVTWNDQVLDAYREMQKLKEGGKPISGLPTGFPIKDKITSGRVGGTLTIVGARPSMGKTTYMLQEITNVVMTGKHHVGVFSLESKSKGFIIKLLSNMTSIDNRILKNGLYDDDQMVDIAEAAEHLAKLGVHLEDKPGVHIDRIRALAQVWKKKYNIQALYLDYLQLVEGEKAPFGGNRDLEIGSVSRGLKKISMELDIPVIALCQLSRKVDDRKPAPIPIMSDLRESGNIEQDADVVEFLYRPDYYTENPTDVHNNSLKGLVEIGVAKNRDGALDKTYVKFIKEFSRMNEIDTMNHFEQDGYSVSVDKSIVRDPSQGFTRDPEEDAPF